MIKVSVIIPVYNAEAYIKECVESVIDQTYRNLEIIIIDDGSADKSIRICKRLKMADRRIRILSQEHRGVSAARNKGLAAASGEYVFFIDGDDVIHPNLLTELVRQAGRYRAELVFCKYIRLNTRQIKKVRRREKICTENTEDMWEIGEAGEAGEWFHRTYSRELSCIGGKMIRRRMIGREQFDESLVNGEDTVFLYRLSNKRIKMSCLKRAWYYYREHTESVTAFGGIAAGINRFNAYRFIRDSEYKKGHSSYALVWEYRYIWKLMTEYLTAKNRKNKEEGQLLKRVIKKEKEHSLYRRLPVKTKILFESLYLSCSVWPVRKLWLLKQRVFCILGK